MRVPRDERFLKGKRVPLYLPSRQIFGGLSFQLYEKTIFVGRDAMKTKLALSISLAALTLGMPGAGHAAAPAKESRAQGLSTLS
jgi:hypothetical protein